MYICTNCNTKTEQWRPWLYERRNKKNIPQEETAVEHEPVDCKNAAISSLEDPPESDVKHHWSHNLVLCTSPGAVSLPVSPVEGRVISLEEKLHDLQEQTKSLQGGLTKLEVQLERVEQLLRTAHVAVNLDSGNTAVHDRGFCTPAVSEPYTYHNRVGSTSSRFYTNHNLRR